MRLLVSFFITSLICLNYALATIAPVMEGHTPSFPFNNGWMGSDLAYSIELPNHTNIWLFGDTYITEPGAPDRRGAQRVTNSIGVSYIKNGEYKIDYYWKDMDRDKPKAVFPHEREDEHYLYWPKDAIVVNNQLLVALVEIHVFDITSPMGFNETGSKLAIVKNYLETPDKWEPEIIDFTPHPNVFTGTRFLLKGEYLYWYSTVKKVPEYNTLEFLKLFDLPIVLQRVKITDIDQIIDKQQYYVGGDNAWKDGFNFNDVAIVMDHASTEMTVHYSKVLKKWVAVYGNFALFSDEVHMRTSDHLEGPWSDPKVIFKFPEMDQASPKYIEGAFGYAAKFHPQFTAPNDSKVLMTYVVNNVNEVRQLVILNSYVPQVVTIDLLAPEVE